MNAISFSNGISGVSIVRKNEVDGDFPKSKSSLKPLGENVVAYTWRALEYGKTFENREMRFALNIPEYNQVLSPEEHSMMTRMAVDEFLQLINKGPEIETALNVLKESKDLQESLQMSRNILHAA